MDNNILSLIGLCKKAGRLEVGEEPVGALCRARDCRLLLVAGNAADNTRRRATHFAEAGQCLLLTLPCTKEELGRAVGVSSCAMAAITDVGFAASLVSKLSATDPKKYGEMAERLELKSQRAQERRKEQLRHEKNLRTGKIRPKRVKAEPIQETNQVSEAEPIPEPMAEKPRPKSTYRSNSGPHRGPAAKPAFGGGGKGFERSAPYGGAHSGQNGPRFHDGERKPYNPEAPRRGDTFRPSEGEKSERYPKPERKPYGQGGPRINGGERKPYGQGGPRFNGGERKPYGQNGPRFNDGERKPYGQSGPRFNGGERKPYGQNGPRFNDGERKPYGQSGPRFNDGERKPYGQSGPRFNDGERKPYGQSGPRFNDGERKPYAQGGPRFNNGDRKPYGQSGPRPGGPSRQPYGTKSGPKPGFKSTGGPYQGNKPKNPPRNSGV